ncbi:MAG: hypothetical protein ABEJ08_05975, partial [Halobacteriaceae archaeon]
LTAVADSQGPVDESAAFAAVAGAIPDWERQRRADWRAHWRERTRRLLGWAVWFGLAEATADGYVGTPRLGDVLDAAEG